MEINISSENTLSVNVESTNTDDVLTNPSYTWYLDGIETGGVINGVILQSGEYTLTVTDDLGCEQTSSVLQANLSINDLIENSTTTYQPSTSYSLGNDVSSFDVSFEFS